MQHIGTLLLLLGIGTFVLIYGMRIRARKNELLADLYRQALEKGTDLSHVKLELDDKEAGDPRGNLKAGIFLLSTALAIVLAFLCAERLPGIWKLTGFALIPALLGLAALFIHLTLKPESGR